MLKPAMIMCQDFDNPIHTSPVLVFFHSKTPRPRTGRSVSANGEN
jgi:hypothetical protein